LTRGWKHDSLSKAGAIVVGVALILVLFVPVCRLLANATTTTLIGVNPRVGERKLEPYGLPPNTTSDFCYRFSLVGITILADFQMAEADYLAWVNSQGWEPHRFHTQGGDSWVELPDGLHVTTEVYPVREYDSRTARIVENGWIAYTADPRDWDNTITSIYDLDAERVYFIRTTY